MPLDTAWRSTTVAHEPVDAPEPPTIVTAQVSLSQRRVPAKGRARADSLESETADLQLRKRVKYDAQADSTVQDRTLPSYRDSNYPPLDFFDPVKAKKRAEKAEKVRLSRAQNGRFKEKDNTQWEDINEMQTPLIKEHRKYVFDSWDNFLRDRFPDIPKSAYWHVSTLTEHCDDFLRWRVTNFGGESENGYMTSRTLECFAQLFIDRVLKFGCDKSGQASGLQDLENGLYSRTSDSVEKLIKSYCLTRGFVGPRPLEFFSLPELSLLIHECLSLSSLTGRQAQIQLISMLTFSCISAPGFLTAASEKYVEDALFPKLKNIKHISRKSRYEWSIEVNVDVFQSYNDIEPRMMYLYRGLRLESTEMAHRAMLNPPMWFLLHLVFRGVIEGIDDIEDLFTCNCAELCVKDEMKDLPLFIACGADGRTMLEGKPMTSRSFVNSINRVASRIGLEAGRNEILEQGGSDEVSRVIEVGMSVLAHPQFQEHAATFVPYYPRGVKGKDFVKSQFLKSVPSRCGSEEYDRTRTAATAMLAHLQVPLLSQESQRVFEREDEEAKEAALIERTGGTAGMSSMLASDERRQGDSKVVEIEAQLANRDFEDTVQPLELDKRLSESNFKAIPKITSRMNVPYDTSGPRVKSINERFRKETQLLEGIDQAQLVCCIMRSVSRPVYEERDLDEYCETQGAFKCPKCARMPDRVELRDRAFETRDELNKHVRDLNSHNPWIDLSADMVVKSQDKTKIYSKYSCPSGDFRSSSIEKVFAHCVSKYCKDRAYYRKLERDFGGTRE